MNNYPLSEIKKLSVSDQLLLVQEIWDNIATSLEAQPLTDTQQKELNARLKAFEAHPDHGSPWLEVKARIQGR